MKTLLESLESDWGIYLAPGAIADAIRKIGANQVKIAKAFDEHRHHYFWTTGAGSSVTKHPVVKEEDKPPTLLEAAERFASLYQEASDWDEIVRFREAIEREKNRG